MFVLIIVASGQVALPYLSVILFNLAARGASLAKIWPAQIGFRQASLQEVNELLIVDGLLVHRVIVGFCSQVRNDFDQYCQRRTNNTSRARENVHHLG